MATVMVLEGPLKGQSIELGQPVTRIGRREGNDWVLSDGSVSSAHCEIEIRDGNFILRDLGSTNGSRVNNEPISEQMLYRNDILQLGDVKLMIDGEDVPVAQEQPEGGMEPIPRTTIVITQNKKAAPPKEFVQKKNGNKVWVFLIAILLAVIGYFLYLFFVGK
ncbi:MAG: FHA domain-containing protein [Kiritimatiellae bacterium]|nr:FHA domain-containing protein [Kiritimatiellia bacterium]